MNQVRFLFSDEADAQAYWADKESKSWAVDVTAGPAKRPTFARTFYARARTADGAIEAVKRNMFETVRGARYHARLAGPRELGCRPVSADGKVLDW
ncbi:hypothetical protein [Candidatus Burkholderia verschuerenii]|uniref:hypothetical protein n=1 Tax=Candidatus Burkholderia verschuerenii TaxID=242163 RepID=UPI00067C5752|nr:hypothetical protein [Candidatus Burkholderia verschuerenii]